MTFTTGAKALDALYSSDTGSDSEFLARLAREFTDLLNEWHSRPQLIDTDMDSYIHSIYVDPPQIKKPSIFYSPSSTDACPRSLYEQQRGAQRDTYREQPHKKRWTQIGTAIGDMIQKDLLLIEKHVPGARFKFERTADGLPMFEEFATTYKAVTIDGVTFAICGSPDGVMHYTDQDGTVYRVGLEVKSKQTTPARTSKTSMKEAEAKHIAQVRTYATLFDLDYYLIIYVNAAHKSWNMSDEDFGKTPDIRVFGIDCTEEKRLISLRKMAKVQAAVNENNPPMPDLAKWAFNNYKTAIARSITDEELEALETQVAYVEASNLKDHVKRDYRNALDELKALAAAEGRL